MFSMELVFLGVYPFRDQVYNSWHFSLGNSSLNELHKP